MKQKIWKKNDFFMVADERIDMDPAVVDLSKESVPLTWGFSFNDDLLPHGRVVDLELVDGEIVGSVEFFDPDVLNDLSELMSKKLARYGGFYKDVEETRVDGGRVVTHATLAAVGIVMLPAVPAPKPKED